MPEKGDTNWNFRQWVEQFSSEKQPAELILVKYILMRLQLRLGLKLLDFFKVAFIIISIYK